MTFGKMTIAAAVLAMSGGSAFAGGLSPAIQDTYIAPPPEQMAAASSMGSLGSATPFVIGAVVIGVIAALASSTSGTVGSE